MGKSYNVGKDNPNFGKIFSIEIREKIRLTKLENKNPMWRGDDVGYGALHDWIKSRKQRPLFCEECCEQPPYDITNISQKYLRDLNDWRWLCRRCHMIIDGRINNLRQFATAGING